MKAVLQKVFLIATIAVMPRLVHASHIVGGEISYLCLGNDNYQVTMKVYRDCFNGVPPLDNPAYIGIFNAANVLVANPAVTLTTDSIIPNTSNNPCIIFPPNICVEEGTYVFTVYLPASPGGYTIAYQRCCRNTSIVNLFDPANTGITISATIPDPSLATCNSSPYFNNYPPTVICVNYPLVFDHSATDPDGDSLVYSLCAPFTGATAYAPMPIVPSTPPYTPVTYVAPYSATDPLGTIPPMTIDPVTGLLQVTPLSVGQYVVGVCVSEYRNGNLLDVHTRDFQFNVTTCTLPAVASLPSVLNGCDGFSFAFPNYSTGASSYLWDFGVPGVTDDTSSLFSPTFTYSDTGIYTVTLYANPGSPCGDTATLQVYVYPVFTGGIVAPDGCQGLPVQFLDSTISTFGYVTNWNWTFSNLASSTSQNPIYTFDSTGTYYVQLIVSNSIGCIDTVGEWVDVHPQPVALAFPDTLICYLDTIQLEGSGLGNYLWTPDYGLSNDTVQNPLASPDVTTQYILSVTNEWGCHDEDTILISVFDSVGVVASNDTVICPGGVAQLHASGGANYVWTPSQGLSDPFIADPVATPSATTTYMITTYVGSCSDSEEVKVEVKPLPDINAGPDETICKGDSVLIYACCGTSYQWSPASSLTDASASDPVAFPLYTITYSVLASDTASCPLIINDSVTVFVIDPAPLITTPDTVIYLGTGAQLYAIGAQDYQWTPSDFLSNPAIFNPYSSTPQTITYYVAATTVDGCKLYDSVTITVNEDPLVVFPNAFTPNGDGINDFFKPLVFGLFDPQQFDVFNRWGQLVYESNEISVGWNGTHNGKNSELGVYVYYLKGASLTTGKEYFLKGSVTLLR